MHSHNSWFRTCRRPGEAFERGFDFPVNADSNTFPPFCWLTGWLAGNLLHFSAFECGKTGGRRRKCWHPEHAEISARRQRDAAKLASLTFKSASAGVHSALECDCVWGFSFSIKYNYTSNCQLSVNNEECTGQKIRGHLEAAPQVEIWNERRPKKNPSAFHNFPGGFALFLTTSLNAAVTQFKDFPHSHSPIYVWLFKNI